MNNLYIGLLRLENRAAFFVLAKASQVTQRETAEERFHTLARGWLAYPVTPVSHTHLPPKSGCRCQNHGRFANPITQTQIPCKLFIQPLFGGRFFIQIPTPGRQANLGLRLYNRPSAVAFVIGLRTTMRKTAEERFHTLARGWLAYPVTPRTHIYRRRAVAEASTEAHFVAELFWLQTDR